MHGSGVCAQHGVEVVLKPPNLEHLHAWDGCLISSTSRLLLPVDTCVLARFPAAFVDPWADSAMRGHRLSFALLLVS
jgi:hypothetical protein